MPDSISGNRKTVIPKQQYTCPVESCRVQRNSDNLLFKNASHSARVQDNIPIGKIHEIPDSVTHSIKNNVCHWWMSNMTPNYKIVDNKGISHHGARAIDICLAKYSKKVADKMDVATACYTGVKHALWSAGVLNDYGDMPKGSAYKASAYFDAHPDKFEKVDVKAEDLKSLPAGVIIVYEKSGKDGHIAITNGYGQEMSDCTDNMGWLKAEGKGATFKAYRLTDNWQYDRNTMKLKFVPPRH